MTALHALVHDRLRRTRGAEAAALYAGPQSEAIRHAAGVGEEPGIACDREDAAAYTYAEDEGPATKPLERRDI
ncbi:hypothetical protein [Streptomyces scabiei]|uniref:hypothetical protein n=1 Tax=Streptomyces scabiei TaxID=1930 RepID=UPI003F4CF9D8